MYELSAAKGGLAFIACAIPLALGFLLPAAQLAVWSVDTAGEMIDAHFFELVLNTVGLALATAVIAVGLALFLAYGKRVHATWPVNFSVRLAGMGYAVPGIVIAVGVMLPFAWIDNVVDGWLRARFDVSSGLLLSGTLVALMFAYQVRFLSVSLQTVESGLSKITPVIDEAGRSLGCRVSELFRRVHAPMLRGSLLTAALLVFVDVMKELPATLVLRPFDFNTLAVRAYELATDERLEDASSAALSIVVAGLIPVIVLSLSIAGSRYREAVQAPRSAGPVVTA
jgi:iron(III) transport system permease protein